MRLHPAEKTAGTLPIDTPELENARAVIVAELDRLHWRIDYQPDGCGSVRAGWRYA
jgi:hypothetical protein